MGTYFVRIVVAIKGADLYGKSIALGPLPASIKKSLLRAIRSLDRSLSTPLILYRRSIVTVGTPC